MGREKWFDFNKKKIWERDREKERERGGEADRQTAEIDRQKDRQRNREIERKVDLVENERSQTLLKQESTKEQLRN